MAQPISSNPNLVLSKFTAINQGLDKDKIVLDNFEVVTKYGFTWIWLKFSTGVASLFTCCSTNNPRQIFQINSLVKNLAIFTIKHQQNLTPESKQLLDKILTKLEKKANKSASHKKLYLASIQGCKHSIVTHVKTRLPLSHRKPRRKASETPSSAVR